MPPHSESRLTLISFFVVVALLAIWLSAGMLAVLVVAALADAALTAVAQRRDRAADVTVEVRDR